MRSLEAVQVLRERLGDALVVTSLGTPSYLVHAAGDRPLNFYLWAAMGMASSTGLGLAIAQPDRRVVVVDGDGAAVMNLGGMVTVATRSPTNLLWVILENGAFLETGGQQIATHGPADLVTIAQGCGIDRAARAADPDALARLLDDGLARPDPGGGARGTGYRARPAARRPSTGQTPLHGCTRIVAERHQAVT